MKDHYKLLLQKFNPCSIFVNKIISYVNNESLEETSEIEKHLTECNKCRNFFSFTHLVEHGFQELIHHNDIYLSNPLPLPISVRENIQYNVKLNLSRWILELCRSLMYKNNIIDIVGFYDNKPIHSISKCITKINSIVHSPNNCIIDFETANAITDLINLLKNKTDKIKHIILDFFKLSQHINNNFIDSYLYSDFIYYSLYNSSKAISELEYSLCLNPPPNLKAPIYSKLGRYFCLMNNFDKSLEYYKKANDTVRDPIFSIGIAFLYLKLNELDKSHQHYRNSIFQLSSTPQQVNKKAYAINHLKAHFPKYKNMIYSNHDLYSLFNKWTLSHDQ